MEVMPSLCSQRGWRHLGHACPSRAELVNSLVDPVLADRRSEHEASVAAAEAEIDRLVAAFAAAAA